MVPISPVPLLLLLVLALQSIWSSAPQEQKVQSSPQPEISSLHHPTWSLGLQLYRSLRIDGSQTNTIISPLLLANSLLALEGGAKGSTAGQFHDLLRIKKHDNAVGEALTKALKSVREANGTSYTLQGSSALFSKQVPKLEKSFWKSSRPTLGCSMWPWRMHRNRLIWRSSSPGLKVGWMEKRQQIWNWHWRPNLEPWSWPMHCTLKVRRKNKLETSLAGFK